MRIDGTFLDLRTMAEHGHPKKSMPGGRRCLQVLGDRVQISRLAPSWEAGIGIGYPEIEYAIFCLPDGQADADLHRPVDLDGWLDVRVLTAGHRYWLEFMSVGMVDVSREDSDGTENRWCWSIPSKIWRGIQCG